MFLLRTKRVASELGAKSFRTLYIYLTLDLARRVSRGSHPRAFIASIPGVLYRKFIIILAALFCSDQPYSHNLGFTTSRNTI